MAKGNSGQTLEKLYIELGLDLSQLQADILAADKTVTENLGRLNREKNVIKLRMEADVASLDRVKDATKILEIQEKALNQQLAITKDRMNILLAAYAQVASNANSTALAVNKAEQAFLREKIAVGQLEQQLKSLASQKIPAPTGGLLGGYNNIKVNVSSKINELAASFDKLRVATSSADGAVTTILSTIGKIPTPVGKAVVAIGTLVGLPVLIKNIESSLLDMAKPAIAAGDSFYVMSRGLQLSIADMAKFSTIAKVTGIDVNEASNAIRRFSMQITKSGERNKLLAETMKRYGAELYDETGHLKNALDLSIELSKALKSAQAEGNGAAFRDIVGGKFWSGDVVTWLEDLEGNIEQAKKVVKNGLANPTWAHAIQGEINTLNAQTAQLGSTFSSALMPVAAEIVPKLQEQFGKLTSIIADNKENIKFLGEAMALPVRMLHEFTDGLIALSTAIDEAKAEGTTLGKIFSSMGDYRDDLAALMKVAPTTAFAAMTSPIPNATNVAIAAYRDEIDAWKHEQKAVADAAKEQDRIRQEQSANSQALNKETLEQMKKLEGELEKTEERRIKNAQDAEDIIFGIRHSSYEKQLRDIENWENAQLKSIEELKQAADDLGLDTSSFVLEEVSVYELANAKRIQAEQEKEQKLAEIRQRITAGEQTELEKRIADIEREKQTWIQAGMEKAEAEQLAQQQLSSYVSGINQQLSAEINALGQNDLQKKLSQIEKEKQAWIQKGADVAQAEQLAQQKIRQAHEETESKLNEIRQSVAALDNSEFENKLANIEKEKNAWIQAGMEKAEAEQLAQQKISKVVESEAQQREAAAESYAKAMENYEKQVAKAWEQYYKQVQAAQEEADRKNKQERQEALNLLKSEAKEFNAFMKGGYQGLQDYRYKQLIKQGVNPEYAKQMTPELMDAYRAAQEKADRSFLPNWRDRNSPKHVDKPELPEKPKMPDILKDVPKSMGNVSTSADKAAASLDNLAKSAGYKPAGGVGDLRAYERPDGSTLITNSYQDLKDDINSTGQNLTKLNEPIENTTSALNELPTNIQSTSENFSEMPTAIQSAAGSLNELPTAVQDVMEQISAIEPQQLPQNTELPSVIAETVQSFSQLPTVIQTANDSMNQLPMTFSGLSENLETEIPQMISPMSEGVQEVTVTLSNFATALSEILSQIQNYVSANQATPH